MYVRNVAGEPPLDALVRMLAGCVAAGLLAACAAAVPALPAQFTAVVPSQAPALLVLQAAATVRLTTGYTRDLPAGGRWRAVGSLPQGTVYSPVGTVFSIEGRHVHEAYLVIKDGVLNGFYLPAESAFSPLALPLTLTLGASS
jgi:hypothetical protein